MTAFELDPLPANWKPLGAVVVTKCLDAEGALAVHYAASTTLNTWEVLGMLREAEARELGPNRRTTLEQPGCSTPPQNSNGISV